jgi:hypothetical protein
VQDLRDLRATQFEVFSHGYPQITRMWNSAESGCPDCAHLANRSECVIRIQAYQAFLP